MITVYEDEASADCYQVRIALALLGLESRSIALEEYVADDPDLPSPSVVLVDETVEPRATVHNHLAALLFLCRRHDRSGTLLGGSELARQAEVLDWLAISQDLSRSAGVARRHEAFGEPVPDVKGAQAQAHQLLRVLDRQLWFGEQQGDDFLVGTFTAADIACFGDVVLSEEGGISREDYPAVRRWCDRVKRVPDLPLMSGVFPAAAERTA